MFDLRHIICKATAHSPKLVHDSSARQAAVAVVLRNTQVGAEILFIERASRTADPWSGQMAFPGGRRDAEDKTPMDTAERETFEEVGIQLARSANFGRIDDLVGHSSSPSPGLVISCFLYEAADRVQLRTNYEVQDTIWIPVTSLANPELFVSNFRPQNYDGEFPGIKCGQDDERIVWGLTYRFICAFFKMAGIPFEGKEYP